MTTVPNRPLVVTVPKSMGKRDEGRYTRIPVRCTHPGCGGHLYCEPDMGGHLIDVLCLSCGRLARTYNALELDHDPRWDLSREDMERGGLLWFRVPRESLS